MTRQSLILAFSNIADHDAENLSSVEQETRQLELAVRSGVGQLATRVSSFLERTAKSDNTELMGSIHRGAEFTSRQIPGGRTIRGNRRRCNEMYRSESGLRPSAF